jgi:hypothetical protein
LGFPKILSLNWNGMGCALYGVSFFASDWFSVFMVFARLAFAKDEDDGG